MRDKKHIDRLFQEGLKDFEATPSNAVWKNIEAELNKDKRKRRVIPIWWRYAGVAALLLVFLTLGINTFYNKTEGDQTHEVVNTDAKQASEIENTSIIDEIYSETTTNSAISEQNTQENSKNPNSEKHIISTNKNNNQNTNSNNQTSVTATAIASADHVNQINKNSAQPTQNSNKSEPSSSVKNKKENVFFEKGTNTVAQQNSKESNASAETKNNMISISEEKVIAKTQIENTNPESTKTDKIKTEETSKAIASNDTKENNLSIEDALEKTEDLIDTETPTDRWSLAANAAPVYFNTTGKGSSIDPQFNSNSKSGEVNMSYGVTASYAVNKRLRVRSGINRVNLGYNTNDVIGYQSIGISSNASTLQNISNVKNTGNNNDFININTASSEQLSLISANNLSSKSAASLKTTNISINQNLGYIEVPLELQYALINKKFGINVIGGFSSLFLNNNEVFSEAQDGNRTFLGEANNLNKVSYSANFGLGLNYQVTKKIDLNLEPMLKYQINTFNNTSGDFQPFFVGVYTGIGFKF